MAEVHHETIHFSGRVQGVGFRYTTRQVAQEFEVTGFVQNLVDGRVLLDVEGQPDQINAFVTAIEERMHGLIRQVERRADQRPRQFAGFHIR
jgi:acylphosphatase